MRHALERKRDMDLLEVARLDPHAAAKLRRRRGRARAPREGRKLALGLLDHDAMIDAARRGDHRVGGPVMARQIALEPLAVERAHGRPRAQDRAADRLVRIGDRLQIFENQIVGRILNRADLLDDDVLLARDLVGIEGGSGQDVRQHVEGERHVGLQGARIIGRHLDAGRRIEVAADRLDLLGDLTGRAALGALEGHVLEKMRHAMLVRLFVATAATDPDPERSGLEMRHGVGHDDESGGETANLDAHAAAPSRAARLTSKTNRSTAA